MKYACVPDYLWIQYIPLNENIAKMYNLSQTYWNYIPEKETSIVAWSNAEKAGLKAWDIIIEVDNKKIDEKTNLSDFIQNKIPWDKISLKVLRLDWSIKKLSLTLWEY